MDDFELPVLIYGDGDIIDYKGISLYEDKSFDTFIMMLLLNDIVYENEQYCPVFLLNERNVFYCRNMVSFLKKALKSH